MRRLFIYTMLFFLAITCALFLFLPVKTIEFTQQEVEQVVEAKLPNVIDKGVVTITVNTATIEFKSDNLVSVQTSFEAKGLTLEGAGLATIETGIRYEGGNFYLADLSREDIQFEFSQNSNQTISDIRSSLEGLLNRESYEAEQNGNSEQSESVGKVREYVANELQKDAEEALDKFLSHIPIYSLNSQGGALKLAALALDDVTISEGKVSATLSFQTFIIRVALAVFSALLIALVAFGPTALNIWIGRLRRNSDEV